MLVCWDGLRLTRGRCAAARLMLSDGADAAAYGVYLLNGIRLIFQSADRNRVEHAAGLLRRVGVDAEVKKMGSVWYVQAYTDVLATGREELRRAVAEIVREATARGWVGGRRAEKWLKKLERGVRRGWPKYLVRVMRNGAFEVRFGSTNPDKVEREAQRLREMGLVEGPHFTVRRPEGGKLGYVYIRREGLRRVATAAARGNAAAAEFVELLLQRAEEAGVAVRDKVKKVVEEGRAVGARRLSGMRAEVEVWGRRHAVSVLSWDADWNSRRLRISILAEVDGVEGWYTATFYRMGRGSVAGQAYARAAAPGGVEADAERFAAVVKAVAGREPRMYAKGRRLAFSLGRVHLDGFAQYAELADVVEGWLAESWFEW
ncbi:MAG: PaRep2b protein [Pyrobaculum sp.]